MDRKKRLVWFLLITVILIIGLTGCERDASSFTGTASFGDGFVHGLFFSKLPDSCPSTSGYGWGFGIGCAWSILYCLGGFGYGKVNEKNAFFSAIGGYIGGLINAALVYGLVALVIWIF